MRLLAIKFPMCTRKITVTLQKIVTNTFLDTGCLMSIIYFLFLDKVNVCNRRARVGKVFQLGALPHAHPWLRG